MDLRFMAMRKSAKEFFIFMAVAYGVPFLMSIPMAILFHMGKSIAPFPVAQMLYPTAGLMLAKLRCEREEPLLPRNFFTVFLYLTGLMALWCFTGFFLPETIVTSGAGILLGCGSTLVAIVYLGEGKEKRRAYGLRSQNWGQSILILMLFVALTYGGSFVTVAVTAGPEGVGGLSSPFGLYVMLGLPVTFVMNFANFLGEEYGWRCYFQPLLQKRFGMIKGVFLFGILWEFWHLPLVLCYYAPQESSMSLGQLILLRYAVNVLMAIFMAYAYMKTNNLWLPVLIHFVNNTLVVTGGGDSGTVGWTMIGLIILIKMASYLPFLRSKVFRREDMERKKEVS